VSIVFTQRDDPSREHWAVIHAAAEKWKSARLSRILEVNGKVLDPDAPVERLWGDLRTVINEIVLERYGGKRAGQATMQEAQAWVEQLLRPHGLKASRVFEVYKESFDTCWGVTEEHILDASVNCIIEES